MNKIAIVGEWEWEQYEEAFANGLKLNSIDVFEVKTSSFLTGYWGRVVRVLPIPTIGLLKINIKIIKELWQHRPDAVLFWRPIYILPATLKIASLMKIKIITYNNDDPFSNDRVKYIKWYSKHLWYWYKKCIVMSDYNFFYRPINREEALALGVKHADIMMPYFIPWKDKPTEIQQSEKKKYETDVVFVGHYEPDGRERYINAIVSAKINFKLWGGRYWSKSVLGSAYDQLAPISPAHNEDYQKALAGAKICICFLSKLNRDTYTRRCFEIPACGRLLLSERTDDLLKIFKENEEACFFSTPEELVEKINWLLANDSIRKKIAHAGMKRVWLEGFDVASRAQKFLEAIGTKPK